jgi:HD-GYP domain-containing protein (c-di-GMP phosphodiesterase class II)
VAEEAGDYISTRLSQLKVGTTLRLPIYDALSPRRQLLLAAGCSVADSQLRALRRRGITSVLVHTSEYERLTGAPQPPGTVLSTEQRQQLRTPPVPISRGVRVPVGWRNEPNSFRNSFEPPVRRGRNLARAAEFAQSYVHAAQTTRAIVDALVEYKQLNTRQVTDLSHRHLHEISQDADEFVANGLQPVLTDYPSRHSLQTAMLACSIGTTMGLTREELIELGCGCLLHDAGMLLVPRQLLETTDEFTTAQRLEVQKHPIYAANLINQCADVPQGARHVVYQMHERMNGSGYPRQRGGNQIHPLARIAAVADTYLALVSPRPYRPPLEAYQAVEKLLFSTRQGLFDASVVRALIHTVSLFPIGSGVQLNDGRIGRVIRGNRDQFARPVVEVMTSGEPGEVLNLTERPELAVVSTAELPMHVLADPALAMSV